MSSICQLFLVLSVLISISACSKKEVTGQAKPESAPAEAVQKMAAIVKSNLGSSADVQFGDSIISKSGNRACLEYSAKGRAGDAKSHARFRQANGTWSLETMDAPEESCHQGGFDNLDLEDSAKLKAIGIATSALQKSRHLTQEAAAKLVTDAEPDMDCFSTTMTLAHYLYEVAHDDYYHKLAFDYEINPSNQANVDIIVNHLQKGECPEATDLADELKK